MEKLSLYFAILAFAILQIGCDTATVDGNSETTNLSAEIEIGSTSLFLSQAETPTTVHDRFAELAELAPGFGGIYLDEEQRPHVHLVDPDDRESALQVLRELSRVDIERHLYASSLALRDFSELEAQLQVHQADYDYSQLRNQYQKLLEVVGNNVGIVGVDISSELNRIVVAVEDEFAYDRASHALRELSVPIEMVSMEHVGTFIPDVTLDDKVRPVAGGLRVQTSGSGGCTFGFNASRDPEYGFVTCSHCTGTMGVMQGDPFGQPTPSHFIGVEESDPPFTYLGYGGCPSGGKCRFSDAAYIRYVGFSDFAAGRIVKTTGPGSITLVSTDPTQWFRIVGSIVTPLQGDYVHKIGQTTGWTSGYVQNTCYGPISYGNNNYTLCQVIATYFSGGGDSGSPVFKISSGNDVVLYGVHVGSFSTGERVFSNIYHVLNEVTIGIAF